MFEAARAPGMFPASRLRRMRTSEKMRDLTRETTLSASDLVCPVFVQEGLREAAAVESMPDVRRVPLEGVVGEVQEACDLGIPAVMIFGIPAAKDDAASAASADDGIVQSAIRRVREGLGDGVVVMADVCMCQYTPSGHCGLARGGRIDNDSTLEVLAGIAASQARAGVDVVSPSAMMDGQVSAIRAALDGGGSRTWR